MTKEEIKQYLRNQIESCIKIETKYLNEYFLYHNNLYLRALKLSKITGQPVNKDDFKGGEKLFSFNTKTKTFLVYPKIVVYLEENYSNDYFERIKIIEDIFNEYSEYKNYKYWINVV